MSPASKKAESELLVRPVAVENRVVIDSSAAPSSSQDPTTAATTMEIGPFRIGQTVGRTFEITGVLGFGGMGVVYDAIDRRLLRRVAIKVARQREYADALRREAQGLVAISSSSAFVHVHAMMEEEGVEFIVMERLYGETLQDRIDALRAAGQHFSIDEIVRILASIAEALSTAHRAGVAQRDLKPSNVMLIGGGGRIVLFDFGLFLPEIMVGPSNVPAGSLEYIAPEVILGDVKRGQGPLIDLYSLGAVAFELLMNRTPFARHSTPAGGVQSVLLAHMTENVPDIAAERPDAPRALIALINELLAKKADARPPSAEAVLWQLVALKEEGERMPPMRVLAVDDDPHVGTALKRSLESSFPRLHVDTTTDSRKVVEWWKIDDGDRRREIHDVVLVDLNMPYQNGIDVCMALLTLPPKIRPIIVAMSAEAKTQDIEVLKGLGVRHFVPKDDSFVAAMSSVIGALRTTKMASHHPEKKRSKPRLHE